jgi:O-antigen biosynthesis protein
MPQNWLRDIAENAASIFAGSVDSLRRLMVRLLAMTLPHLPAPVIARLYRRWIQTYERIPTGLRQTMADNVSSWPTSPLISVMMRSHNADPQWLAQTIDSVRNQIYPTWELCISIDASAGEPVRALLERRAAADTRLRLTFCNLNSDITMSSNAALEFAGGDHVALLDANDLLSEDALYWVARELAIHPEADLLFSDEDKIDGAGRRFEPYFKSAWNPAFMLSQNAFSHLGVFRRELVKGIGGFRKGYEGAEDYDLILRCAERTDADRIRHIPRVLYHRRTPSLSAVTRAPSATERWEAGKLAIIDHLKRADVTADVRPALGIFYQIDYSVPQPPPLVSLIVPSTLRNNISAVCLRSVLTRTSYHNFEMLILAHSDHLRDAKRNADFTMIFDDPRVRVVDYEKSPFNFSRVSNLGAQSARGAFLCFLNDDVEVITKEWLERLVARAAHEDVGATGPMMYYPSDRIQHAGALLGVNGIADHAFRLRRRGYHEASGRGGLEQDYSCVTAACMLMRRTIFVAVGGFDESLPVAFNDIDLCIRTRRAGARIIWTPLVEMYHHESLTLGSHISPTRHEQFRNDVKTMHQRWGEILDADPYYNPNLSIASGLTFSLAWPPRLPDLKKVVSDTTGMSISRTSRLTFVKT